MTPPVPGPLEGLNAAVAAQIRAEAAAAQLTDKALAAKADVNYASLRRWLGKDEGNARHIDLAVLSALAEALDISPAEIVRRAIERQSASDELAARRARADVQYDGPDDLGDTAAVVEWLDDEAPAGTKKAARRPGRKGSKADDGESTS